MSRKLYTPQVSALVVDHSLGLTALQLRFAREYMGNGYDATKAALAAGCSLVSASSEGSRLRREPSVIAWLELNDEGTYAAHKRKRRMVAALWRNDRLAVEGNPVTDKDGNIAGYKRDLASSNRAIELIGKLHGDFVERVAVSGDLSLSAIIAAARAPVTVGHTWEGMPQPGAPSTVGARFAADGSPLALPAAGGSDEPPPTPDKPPA